MTKVSHKTLIFLASTEARYERPRRAVPTSFDDAGPRRDKCHLPNSGRALVKSGPVQRLRRAYSAPQKKRLRHARTRLAIICVNRFETHSAGRWRPQRARAPTFPNPDETFSHRRTNSAELERKPERSGHVLVTHRAAVERLTRKTGSGQSNFENSVSGTRYFCLNTSSLPAAAHETCRLFRHVQTTIMTSKS